MRIRLVVLEHDEDYLGSFQNYFEKKFAKRVEIVGFTREDRFNAYLETNMVDVILLDDKSSLQALSYTSRGRVAWFAGSDAPADADGILSIGKYKKAELIFQDILNLYATGRSTDETLYRAKPQPDNANCTVYMVTAFSGGVGVTTVAAALAKVKAASGAKTVYVDLQNTGDSSVLFSGDGRYAFQDVIYSIKSRTDDMAIKIESCLCRDSSNVCFFKAAELATYMQELELRERCDLIAVLKQLGFVNIIIDMNYDMSPDTIKFLDKADRILIISSGSQTGNAKFVRTLGALPLLERDTATHILDKACLIYNNFSTSKSSEELQNLRIPVIGKISPIHHATTNEIVQYIFSQKSAVFARI